MTDSQTTPVYHLSERAEMLFDSLREECAAAGRTRILRLALEAWDIASAARYALESRGLAREALRPEARHPLAKIERDMRRQFARIWRAMSWPGVSRSELDGYTDLL